MKPGRAPNWNVVADIEPSTWLEPVELASDSRLLLPVNLRKRVPWCAPQTSLALLATIGADGGVAVAPMTHRKEALAAIRAALASSGPEMRQSIAYAAMANFSQVSLQPDGRLRLSPTLSLHLRPDGKSKIWVGAHDGAITLWSERDWAASLHLSSETLRTALADMPE